MPDTTSRSRNSSSSSTSPSQRSAGSSSQHLPPGTTARPAGGPNGGGGVRPGAPRPGGGPARPGGPGAPRPGNAGRPGGGRPGGGGGNHSGGGRGSHGGPGGRSGRNGTHGRSNGNGPATATRAAVAVKPSGPIAIPQQIVVKDLAELLSVSVNEVIRDLITIGVFANVNEVVNYDAAAKVAEQIGYTPEEAAAPVAAPPIAVRPEAAQIGAAAHANEVGRITRPPVVTVMGHVDHGKTSLLDAIRHAQVAEGEAGGITQHIGAYQVEVNGRKITFLDTPGHEAFTQMRARGAQVTDIAVIVVAADDGVMPQTIEAIDHARAAQVPIVVALNKIDKANANPDHVKQQLAEHGVVIEEYGGDVVCVPVSAKRQTGITELLELILLVADLQDLKANPNGPAHGVVIEARLDQNTGVTANALVQDGTLKISDTIVVGTISGRVRAMFDDKGERIRKATPSTPVSILGLSEVPAAGDRLEVVADEKAARTLIQKRREASRQAGHSITLDTLYMQMREGKIKELNLLVKSDVQGSAEAIRHALTRVGEEHAEENLKIRLIQDSVGNVSETDVYLASASNAIIIAFNVRVDPAAQRLASVNGVDVRSYNIIYKLVEDIEAALKGLLEPVYREQVDGHAEVMQIFKVGRQTTIGGCRVTDGKIVRSSQVRVQRGGQTIFTGLIESLRRGRDDVREVSQGYECGILLEDFNALEMGDIIEAFSKVRV
ncbi:MAG TPA: translation initiation factor IF-2 [Ktedonobacterales bacterium]